MAESIPKISIVTPSYNQAPFIEEAIQSVLSQNYPAIEYIIVDGGSTDKSAELIRKYEKQLAYWVSEPDKGQYDAINKGFSKTTGEIMAWLNSDDKYTPWAFQVVGEIFSTLPEVEWLTTLYPLFWDECGRATRCSCHSGFSRKGFFRGESLPGGNWYATGFIQQESTFWRRSLWERAGQHIDASLHLAGDFELWARFYQHAELYGVGTPLGGFRKHENQKTADRLDAYVQEAVQVLSLHSGGRPCGRLESFFRGRVLPYIPASVAIGLQLLDPTRICVHEGLRKGWRVSEVYRFSRTTEARNHDESAASEISGIKSQ